MRSAPPMRIRRPARRSRRARRVPGPCPCLALRRPPYRIPGAMSRAISATEQGDVASAAHAWAEVLVPDLGWVGFDAANGKCPTDDYVRWRPGLTPRASCLYAAAGAAAPMTNMTVSGQRYAGGPVTAGKRNGRRMTYGVGLLLKDGFVLAADTRTNAGVDNIATFKKLHSWQRTGRMRASCWSTSGNLAITQAVGQPPHRRTEPNRSKGARPNLFSAKTMFQAARIVGTRGARGAQDRRRGRCQSNENSRRQFSLRRPDRQRAAAAVFQIYSAGQFHRGDRRHALSPDRRA